MHEVLVHVRPHLAVQRVVEQGIRMDAPVVHVNGGEEKELGLSLRELERHRVHRGSLSCTGGLELEDRESIVSISGEFVPYAGRDAKALIKTYEIVGPRYE